MSIANDSLMYVLGLLGFALDDNLRLTQTSQALADPVRSEVNRITSAVANGAMQLKSSLSNDAPPVCFVLNDSAQTVKVFPATGENQGGVANASLSIPAGQGGIFIRVPVQTARAGGAVNATLDWRSAVIP
jgi:hypothetical protein